MLIFGACTKGPQAIDWIPSNICTSTTTTTTMAMSRQFRIGFTKGTIFHCYWNFHRNAQKFSGTIKCICMYEHTKLPCILMHQMSLFFLLFYFCFLSTKYMNNNYSWRKGEAFLTIYIHIRIKHAYESYRVELKKKTKRCLVVISHIRVYFSAILVYIVHFTFIRLKAVIFPAFAFNFVLNSIFLEIPRFV